MKDTIVTGCDTPKKKKKAIKIAESLGFEGDKDRLIEQRNNGSLNGLGIWLNYRP